MKIRTFILSALIIFIALIFFLFIFRIISSAQLDDISPQIQCDEELLEKSDILFVIPIYNNISIAENKTWCQEILALNKTLGMHGVYHFYQEFYEDIDDNYLNKGKEEFKKCFGFYPEHFKAPQLAITNNNRMLIKSQMKFYGYLSQYLHKDYHCNDTGKIRNKIINWF
jgi:hypothetical protein